LAEVTYLSDYKCIDSGEVANAGHDDLGCIWGLFSRSWPSKRWHYHTAGSCETTTQ